MSQGLLGARNSNLLLGYRVALQLQLPVVGKRAVATARRSRFALTASAPSTLAVTLMTTRTRAAGGGGVDSPDS